MIEEADGIMHDAMAGLDILKTTPDLMTTLERHIATLYRELKQKGKLNEQSIRLEWTGPSGSTERAAVADAQFLLVRGDAA
ncbi:MAG: hypothetical protein HND48_04255 [Chloroflexi bacterium]|nr:hypothetical protein [Chloroflexota bacterium]